jgi:hypothetical protein
MAPIAKVREAPCAEQNATAAQIFAGRITAAAGLISLSRYAANVELGEDTFP